MMKPPPPCASRLSNFTVKASSSTPCRLLEKLSVTNPSDFVVKEHWAYCILEYSKTLPDPAAPQSGQAPGAKVGDRGEKLGDAGELLETLLSIPEDGSDLKFSERADVDEAMKAAEASRAKGNLDEARKGYLHVLELDPQKLRRYGLCGRCLFFRACL